MRQYTIKYYTPATDVDSVVLTKTVTISAETEQSAVNKFEQMYDNCLYISVHKEEE